MTTAIVPKDGYLEANGLRLHYLEWGERGSPDMLLLHGLTSHAHSWDFFARALADRYHIIALDQRGHGDSARPADASFRTADYVADAKAVVDALGMSRFVLIGLSMGAHNAMAFTAAHPQYVTHLVPVDIAPALSTLAERRARAASAPEQPREFDSVEAAYQHARAQNPRPPEDVHRHRVEHSLKQLPDGRFELKYDPKAPANWDTDDLWASLPKIACPVLVVRGAESEVLDAATAEREAAAFPNGRLVTIEGSGHPVPLDRPAEFEQAVREFLASS
jgi:pimeloyl-ACP methyl ester carboxylesterase